MSPETFRKISLPELEVSLYLFNFSKEVSQLTDWQTYKKFRIIWKWCNNIPVMSPKIFIKIPHLGPEMCLYLSNFSKDVSQLTDWQTHKKFRIIWKWCNNILGMSPKIFRKISHSGPEICLYLSNFSKEVSQLTDWQTYKKFRIIWKWCNNIPGMSPKFFRKISHPGPEISLYLFSFSKGKPTTEFLNKCHIVYQVQVLEGICLMKWGANSL